ncbi:MAG: hypothetical protein A2150_01975 [Candidatus Muproteobacteria bacterium RBG_16_64_11]|uniref:HpcH/HpaI aldolase/citrate lyase domain-containing protein n=1 Tax=Candidatus Muproteobacteria bacterium RBG_16_64_11 TaxID=1817758 RepID=A0A1F6TDC0_9PROT|nr:MAG: hypothetical protein A2150_01975 [Candidatus Muproteobacteria bacterium RBG_16_64_11]
MNYGDDFTLTLFTNNPLLAERADRAGVDRIGLDLERIGKNERQGKLATWISDHQEAELAAVRARLTHAKLFVRTNPIHPGSESEIQRLIEAGAEVLMLPMFTTVEEVSSFVNCIAGRARSVLLLETAGAARAVQAIVRHGGFDEIHIGLNDLHLSLGLNSHFALLVSELMESLCGTLHAAGIRYGFGGIGRAGDNDLPIPADLIYAQYPRLNASGALISRAFYEPDALGIDWSLEILRARASLNMMIALPPDVIEEKRVLLAEKAGFLKRDKKKK